MDRKFGKKGNKVITEKKELMSVVTRPMSLRFTATAAARQTVDRECAWKHSPIVERINSEGSPVRGARCFEVKQPLADVTWSSKEERRVDRHADQHSPT
ncbi:hypothetical protein CDAR_217931 [Caerostris darwini]|uniref:Uncharacterized protein n=1 Tax=Caerostris darwini TaxID=1538125 RepID=A0AAV4VPG5_9ARAC|nr:hypothetical protein CDAR_217931 [Caerostris darwini]